MLGRRESYAELPAYELILLILIFIFISIVLLS
jgi:hypothetical protein